MDRKKISQAEQRAYVSACPVRVWLQELSYFVIIAATLNLVGQSTDLEQNFKTLEIIFAVFVILHQVNLLYKALAYYYVFRRGETPSGVVQPCM